MSYLRSYATLPGGRSYSYTSKCVELGGCPFRRVAVVLTRGRRSLPILAAKFTVNTSNHQAIQTIPTSPAPTAQPTGVGLVGALAGGLVALTGVAALIVSARRKSTDIQPGAGDADQSRPTTSVTSAGVQVTEGTVAPGSSSGRGTVDAGGEAGLDSGLAKGSLEGQPTEATSSGGQAPQVEGQHQRLELERARARQATSELQNELLDRERELLEAQREGAAQVAGARVELKESRRKVELLEAMVGALREKLRREEGRNAALEEAVETGRAEVARMAEQRQELQRRIDVLRMELKDTQARLLVAQARAAELDARLVHLVAQNKELERRVGELESQLQTRTSTVAGAAAAAEDKLRQMQAAADEDRLHIAKLQGKLAEREAQLAVLREGEKELQAVLEQSKTAAGQMGELLRQRDAEMVRLQAALQVAEGQRAEQEKSLNGQIAAVRRDREANLRRLQLMVEEAEARRMAEAGALRKELEELRRRHEAEVKQLRAAGSVAGSAAQAEVEALKEQIAALQSERDKEVALLNSQLQDSARHAEGLRATAKAQAAAQEEEVQALRKQLEDAQLRAEQASARRVAEVSELRSALEQQLGAARQEALDARLQLAAVKEQLDGVLNEEFLNIMEEELRQTVLPATSVPSAAKAAFAGAPETVQELRGLESREAGLGRQLEALQAELAELQSAAVARLGPAMVVRAQELETAAAQNRRALRAREAVGDQPGVQRITQQLASLNSELAALYRSVMLPEARARERAVRLELQDREIELRGVVEQQIRLQDRLEQERRAMQERKDKAVAAASGPLQVQLRTEMQARIKNLLKERERQAQEQAAAREKQLQAQLRAAQAGSESQQRELQAVQEAVQKQARLIEESWKVQLEASSRALQEAALDKQRLALELSQSTDQVRQQLAELEALRRELLAARTTVSSLRRAAEGSRDSAAQQSVGAAQEVQRLAAQVQQLQDALQERERQYAATSAQAVAQPAQPAAPRGGRSGRPAGAASAPAAAPAAAQPPRVPPVSNILIRRNGAAAAAGTATVEAPPPPAALATAGVVAASPAAATAVQSDTAGLVDSNGNGGTGVKPLTPLRPGWPEQYGEVKLSPSLLPPQPTIAAGKVGTVAAAPPAATDATVVTAPKPATTVGPFPRVGVTRESTDAADVGRSGTSNGNGNGTGGAVGHGANAGSGSSSGNGSGAKPSSGTGPSAAVTSSEAAPNTRGQDLRNVGMIGGVGGKGRDGGNGAGRGEVLAAPAASPVDTPPTLTQRQQASVEPANAATAAGDLASAAQRATAASAPASASSPQAGPHDFLWSREGGDPAQQRAGTQAAPPRPAAQPAGPPSQEEQPQQLAMDAPGLASPRAGAGGQEQGPVSAGPRSAGASTGGAMPVAEARPPGPQAAPHGFSNGAGSSNGAATFIAPSMGPAQLVTPPDPPRTSSPQPSPSPPQHQPPQQQPPQQQPTQQAPATAPATAGPQPQAPRRSVPPGPFYATNSFPLQAGEPLSTASPWTEPAPVWIPSPAAASAPPAAPSAPAAVSTDGATSGGAGSRQGADDPASSAATAAAATASQPTTAKPSDSRATASPPSPAAAVPPSPPPPPPPPAASQPAPTGRAAAPAAPPAVEPLTPIKVPTPADFPDFVRAGPTGSSNSNSSSSSSTTAGPSPSTAAVPGSIASASAAAAPTAAQWQAPPPPQPPASAAQRPSMAQAQAPQSPAAQAMAAAAGAAEAARRAAAAAASAASAASPSKPPGFKTSPISEWGRPASAADEAAPAASGRPLTGPGPGPGAGAGAGAGPGGATSTPANDSGGTFFSEAELGAEIAAIAQSLVQRTIGGAAAPRTAGSPAVPRGPNPPPVAASNVAAFRQGNAGVPAAPMGAATAGSVRRLQLSVGAYGVPHVAKAEKGSEDAYFMVTPSGGVVTSGPPTRAARPAPPGAVSALGIADGVGGWAEANVDPGQYSREVMEAAARAAADGSVGADPRRLLAVAQDATRTIGSCTACVAVLTDNKGPSASGSSPGGEAVLSIANLGDSGCRVVRRGSLVLATSAQEHQFNMPYQMAHPDNLPETDTAEDAQMYQLALEPGDVVLLATDGLFDNMWDEELVSLVSAAAAAIPPGLAGPAAAAAAAPAAQQLAASLVGAAFRHAQDPAFRSPWAVELANQPTATWLTRLFPRGGKMDDITAVVAIVTPP